jgi:hypothetical protein
VTRAEVMTSKNRAFFYLEVPPKPRSLFYTSLLRSFQCHIYVIAAELEHPAAGIMLLGAENTEAWAWKEK